MCTRARSGRQGSSGGEELASHVTVDASVFSRSFAHMGNPGIYLSMVLLFVRSSVVTCVLEAEKPRTAIARMMNAASRRKGSGDFVTHVEGWEVVSGGDL